MIAKRLMRNHLIFFQAFLFKAIRKMSGEGMEDEIESKSIHSNGK